jgi:hypothetical protein
MKKLFLIITLFGITIFFSNCKKDTTAPVNNYKCASCKTTPDAIVANDGSSKGVYKGIVIGSTGTIQFNIMNGGSTISAIMVLDGTTINLTASVAWTAGVSYVSPFTGTLNGSPVTIQFQVDANGGNPVAIATNIPGHSTAQLNIAKETSNALLECFEGTYESTRPESGTFNLMLSRSLGKMGGSSRKNGATTNGDFNGTVTSDGKLMIDGTNYIGTINGDSIDGTFKDNEGRTITVKGKRTL